MSLRPSWAFNLVVGLVIFCSVMIAAVVVPASLNASSNTEAAARTDALAACRAQSATAVNDATLKVFVADGEVQAGIASSVLAAIRQDEAALVTAAAELEAAQVEYHLATATLAAAAADRADAIALSQSDPDGFLNECKEQQ